MNNQRSLSCEEVRALLDGGVPADCRAGVDAHLAHCPDCRAEARIRELSASLAEAPPPGFTDGVMRLVRAERTRELRRRVILRRVSAAAAALVLVPVLAVAGPRLMRAEQKASFEKETPEQVMMFAAPPQASPETTGAAETMAEAAAMPSSTDAAGTEVDSDGGEDGLGVLFGVLLPDGAANGTENAYPDAVSENSAGTAEAEIAPAEPANLSDSQRECAEVTPAPGYVGKQESADSSETTTALSVCGVRKAPADDVESALRVLASLVGQDALDEWLAGYSGDAYDAARQAAAAFSVSKDAFSAKAQEMEITVSAAMFAAMFG